MRWRGPPDDALQIVSLDMLTAIYDRRSGQTHIVSAPVPEILAVLMPDGMSIDAIIAALGIADDDDTRALLHERLTELAATGLVDGQ